jgi:tetratricopeptide (TPR) repeat protein
MDPTFALGYHSLGLAYSEQGLLKMSIEAYRRAVELDPRLVETRFNLALAYLSEGRETEAIQELQRVVSLRTDFSAARLHLSRLRTEQQQYREALSSCYPAIKQLRRALKDAWGRKLPLVADEVAAELADGYRTVGRARMQQGLLIRLTLRENRVLPRIVEFLGAYSLFREWRFHQAKSALEEALKLDSTDIRSLMYLADYHVALDRDTDKAVKYLDQALEVDPNNKEIHQRKAGLILRRCLGDLEESFKAWRESNSWSPRLQRLIEGLDYAEGVFRASLIANISVAAFWFDLAWIHRMRALLVNPFFGGKQSALGRVSRRPRGRERDRLGDQAFRAGYRT